MIFPPDSSNPSLNSSLEILFNSFVHDEHLVDLGSEALEAIFDLSQLSPEVSFNTNDEVSWGSLKSDEMFSGSLSSLEEILFKDLMENHWKSEPDLGVSGDPQDPQEQTRKAPVDDEEDVFIVVDDLPNQDNFSTPRQTAVPVVVILEESNPVPEKKPPTPFKRKQDLSSFRHESISFDSNTSIENRVKSRGTPRLKLVSYQDAYAKTVPPKKVEFTLTRCDGCEKMFKKIQLHKCKGLVKTISAPVMSLSRSKFKCKFCSRSFRSENLFHNHLNSHLEVSPVTRPIHVKRRL